MSGPCCQGHRQGAWLLWLAAVVLIGVALLQFRKCP